MEKIRSQLKNKDDLEILDWVTQVDYGPQQSDLFNRRQSNTGQWFLDSSKYRTWCGEPNQTLFCPGIPGAGKTILSSIVVNDLYEKFSDTEVGIAYIFCNFKRAVEQTVEGLLSSLLKQLSERKPSLPKLVKDLYNTHKTRRTRPYSDELLTTIQSVIHSYSRVYLVVDALDECQVSSNTRDKFLSALFNIQSKTNMNMLATSRFNPDIQRRFTQSAILEIHATENDIQRYVSGAMVHLPSFIQENPKLQEMVKTGISNAAHGM